MTPLTAPAPATPDTLPGDVVAVASDLLGALVVPASACYTFAGGLYAFEDAHGFALVPVGREGLWWLQSTERPGLVFLVADPFHFWPGYEADVPDAELAAMGEGTIPAAEQLLTLAIVTLPAERGEGASANLCAPLVLDTVAQRGRQVVLPGSAHGVREPLHLA
jgi:flagellar assembly factor FliW